MKLASLHTGKISKGRVSNSPSYSVNKGSSKGVYKGPKYDKSTKTDSR